MKPKTLDQLNPEYFDYVKDRMRGKEKLVCLEQAAYLLGNYGGKVRSCLDIGSASGYLYNYIHALMDQYFGIDMSSKFIKYGQDYFAEHHTKNATLICADFMNHDFQQCFDAIVCLGVFYTFPNYHEHLSRMFVLCRKTIIIRALFGKQTEYRYVPVMPGKKDYCYYNIFGYSDITDFVLSYGWTPIWIKDWYVESQGGHYTTAGLDFPFAFLVCLNKANSEAAFPNHVDPTRVHGKS